MYGIFKIIPDFECTKVSSLHVCYARQAYYFFFCHESHENQSFQLEIRQTTSFVCSIFYVHNICHWHSKPIIIFYTVTQSKYSFFTPNCQNFDSFTYKLTLQCLQTLSRLKVSNGQFELILKIIPLLARVFWWGWDSRVSPAGHILGLWKPWRPFTIIIRMQS